MQYTEAAAAVFRILPHTIASLHAGSDEK